MSKRNQKYVLRWILLGPAILISWSSVFLAGVYSLEFFTKLTCPKDRYQSGRCYGSEFNSYENIYIVFLAFLSASIVLVTAYWVAPTHKIWSTSAVFFSGCLTLFFLI